MIAQDLINKVNSYIVGGQPLPISTTEKLVDAYSSIIEQNAELHKELALYKGGLEYVADRVFVANGGDE